MIDLLWNKKEGYGYYPVSPSDWPYDERYFEKYLSYEKSTMGAALNVSRAQLTKAQMEEGWDAIDIGIGCGTFIQYMLQRDVRIAGYDVNPCANDWLAERNLYANPRNGADCFTFWDSFEHIARPDKLLPYARRLVVMSIPIFRDEEHARASKHFRPTEHYWYFTREGLMRFMWDEGFNCIVETDFEQSLGREDIGTFVFKRQRDGRPFPSGNVLP